MEVGDEVFVKGKIIDYPGLRDGRSAVRVNLDTGIYLQGTTIIVLKEKLIEVR